MKRLLILPSNLDMSHQIHLGLLLRIFMDLTVKLINKSVEYFDLTKLLVLSEELMRLEINNGEFSIQWGGTYYFALQDYPNITETELNRITKFIAYEKYYNRKTEIICENIKLLDEVTKYISSNNPIYPFYPKNRMEGCIYNEQRECITSDFISHTTTIENAKSILIDGEIKSATKAFSLSNEDLVKDQRNAAGDPPDYFDYVMFAWSNVNSGYRLAMERHIGRNPNEEDLNECFVPGVSFHFKYEDILNCDEYIFDGYHPAKVKNSINLDKLLYMCIIPEHLKKEFEEIIPESLSSRVNYLSYNVDGLIKWNQRVNECLLKGKNRRKL